MTSLEMVYTRDGILALLKRHPCTPYSHTHHVGCDGFDHNYVTITALHVIQPGEEDWVWHRCPTRHQADV